MVLDESMKKEKYKCIGEHWYQEEANIIFTSETWLQTGLTQKRISLGNWYDSMLILPGQCSSCVANL